MVKLFHFILLFILASIIFSYSKEIIHNDQIADINITKKINTDSLPPDFPPIKIITNNNPASGVIMFPCSGGKGFGNYLVYMNADGTILKYKKLSTNASNFTLQPNGLVTYNVNVKGYFKAYSDAKIYIADTSLTVIDSIVSGNGYLPAPHVSKILPNGHYLYASYEAHNIDMSKVIKGGNPNALVAGAILVEMDIDKNVVFFWRSWDFIPVEDTYQPINDFLNITTLYSNFNSVDVDFDGNYLLSNRLLSEITKVNRKTGEIIWRLGGKHNQFTFINEHKDYDPLYFSLQHDIRFMSNGNISLFDNGDQHSTPHSRAVEYKLDETAKTATLAWEYIPDSLAYALSAGSNQRLSNGNTIIGWGNNIASKKKDITEVDKDGKVTFELALPTNNITFKALKFPYPFIYSSADVTKYEVVPQNTYLFDNGSVKTGVKMIFSNIVGFMYNNVRVQKYDFAPVNPRFNTSAPFVLPYRYWIDQDKIDSMKAEIRFNVSNLEWMKNPEEFTIFVRDTIGSGYFIPLNTTYDQEKQELLATTTHFGEYIFGRIEQQIKPLSPILVTPYNNQKVNCTRPVKFFWSPRGYYTSTHFIIAEDSNFTNVTFEVNNLKITSKIMGLLTPNKIYYWKTTSTNDAGESDWSPVYTFSTAMPYIKILYPNGGEKLAKDSTKYFIRWEHNISDSVKIELYKNGTFVSIIKDSLLSNIGCYVWQIPTSVQLDSTYRIKVTSIKDVNVNAISQGDFAIVTSTDVKGEQPKIADKHLFIYPNPVNNLCNISFNLDLPVFTTVCIYDIDGNKVTELITQNLDAGQYQFTWNPLLLSNGIYYCKIKTLGFEESQMIILNK